MPIEHGFVPEDVAKPKQEQKETEPAFVETYELKDKEGNAICTVEATYLDADPKPVKWAHRDAVGRQLKTFVFEKDGKSVDLLDLIGLVKPVRMFVSNVDSDKFYRYKFEQKAVFVPPLSHPMGVAIALHELGHAKQYETPFFRELGTQKPKSPQIFLTSTDYRQRFQDLAVVYPELKDRLPSEDTLGQMDAIREEAAPIFEHREQLNEVENQIERWFWEVMEKRIHWSDYEDHETGVVDRVAYKKARKELLNGQKDVPEKIDVLEQELNRLETLVEKDREEHKRLQSEFRKIARPLDQVLLAPIRIAERDATKRAFQWMSKVRDAIGADLLSAQTTVSEAVAERLFSERNLCAESTKRVANNIEKFGGFSAKGALLRALGSYDAFEKFPVPSLKRLEQMERDEKKK